MTSLTIIADDFTGALDTGVQFANKNVSVKVVSAEQYVAKSGKIESDIVVIAAETRHLPSRQAYESTLKLVRTAKNIGTKTLYIKTDSGLRGNIGANLCAAVDGFETEFAAFAPAFPDMNRITRGGVQYIDGVPMNQSVFSQDPFEPVTAKKVCDLLEGWNVQVKNYAKQEHFNTNVSRPTVGVFDVETNYDFEKILRHLSQEGKLQVLAGCAGFAAAMVPFLHLDGPKYTTPYFDKSLLVICGSLNPITQKQLEYGKKFGYTRFILQEEQMKEIMLGHNENCQWLQAIKQTMQTGEAILIDTFTTANKGSQIKRIDENEKNEEKRAQIACLLGDIIRILLDEEAAKNYLTMVIGGDTLLGFVHQLHNAEIIPICEIFPGAVLFSIVGLEKEEQILISKSGGFGEENLLVQIGDAVCERTKDESLYS